MNVLVTAASKEGATTEITEAIAGVLRKRGLDTIVVEPDHVDDVRGYDAFVIGSAVYAGHWLQPATQLAAVLGPALAGAALAIGGLAVLDDRFIPGRATENDSPAAR